MPRPDIALPPRRPAPSVQTQGSLPPRHIPKHLVMPTPLQPLEDQKRAEAARQLREQAVPGTRSDDGHGVRQDARTHGGRHLQHHHSVSYSHQPNVGPPLAPQMSSRQSSQGRAQAIPISAGPNVLRKRASNTVSVPIAAPEPTSSASAAVFSARVVEPTNGVSSGGKTKVIGQVATAVWTRDRVKEEEIRRQAEREAGEKKLSRKLSKLTRKATK
ncbi:hypothetical protein IEO21_01753 [Rhodonia placenta]|uniref:Uncharacterized protein n=1 Tax=Rhodonia placenta TaxID=104341 RepID=A0A8H7P8U6_9APHY|nr:hypothetical protein IEO21_01753 [Postia placenta]